MRDYNISGDYIVFELCKASDNVHIIEVIAPVKNDGYIDFDVSKEDVVECYQDTDIFERFGLSHFESNDAIEEMRNKFDEGGRKRYIFEETLSALNRTFGAYVEDFSRIRVVINAIKHRLLKQIERQEYGKRMSINELLFGGE